MHQARRQIEWGAAGWILLSGLLAAHGSMLFSGFGRLQTDLGDSRLINVVLEHSYQWVRANPLHRDFWSPPFFFPARNVTAYSDCLLSVAPPYWLARCSGLVPDTAFGVWMVAVSVLNFVVAAIMFRKGFGLSVLPASTGAFILAFGAPRINQLGHQQLLPTFYPCLAVLFLTRLFAADRAGTSRHFCYWCGAALAMSAQFYAGFYLAWFFGLAVLIALAIGLQSSSLRPAILKLARRDGCLIAIASVLGGLSLVPFLQHYLVSSREIGNRYFPDVVKSLPGFWSWFNMGPASWTWGWTSRLENFRDLSMDCEQRLGIGLLTPVVAGYGLWRQRQDPACRVLGLCWIGIVLISSPMWGIWLAGLALLLACRPTAWCSRAGRARTCLWLVVAAVFLVAPPTNAWFLVFRHVPGASAIRAVGRIALVALLPAALGLAMFLQRSFVQSQHRVALLLISLCLLEQTMTPPSYDRMEARLRVAGIAKRIPRDALAFYYTPGPGETLDGCRHLDAMWASMETGVPTVNGYSGGFPKPWQPLSKVVDPSFPSEITAALAHWARHSGLEADQIARIDGKVTR